MLQRRKEADPRYLIGRGKLEELSLQAMQLDADVLIFDRDLTPRAGARDRRRDRSQGDRPHQLILDIFAQRAQSRDGKLQVELAQLHYCCRGWPEERRSLSPAHRRHRRPRPRRDQARDRPPPRARAHHASREAASSSSRPSRQARRRAGGSAASCRSSPSSATPTPASRTLLNTLTGSDVLAEDKLFATLDPTTRRLRFPRRARGRHHRHRRASSATCPRTWSPPSAPRSRSWTTPTCCCTWSTPPTRRTSSRCGGRAILDDLGPGARRAGSWCGTRRDRLSPELLATLVRTRGGVAVSAISGAGLEVLLQKADRTLFAEGGSDALRRIRARRASPGTGRSRADGCKRAHPRGLSLH